MIHFIELPPDLAALLNKKIYFVYSCLYYHSVIKKEHYFILEPSLTG